ncbi:hypothetical protein PG999_007591 [Apiospora kogelbergensis]|uniref:Uncharacterized protein n=1 Tax=Apiospora kogelbergensis TaxID=1337665 RepID=A0AAW0QNF1_9PEZI
MSAPLEAFPLRNTDIRDLESLCKILWGWPDCARCDSQNPCSGTPDCSWHRFKKLNPFFDHYRVVTKRYIPDFEARCPQALRNHSDLQRIIGLLRNNPDAQLSHLTAQCFNLDGTAYTSPPTNADQRRAFSLALHIMSMVTVVVQNSHVNDLEAALLPDVWADDVSPAEYLGTVLQTQGHAGGGAFPSHEQRLAQNMEVSRVIMSLKARRLRKIGKLDFEATDNLNNHLKLDKKKGVVKLFRHAAFLKEQLLASRTAQTSTLHTLFEGPELTDGLRCVRRLSRHYALEVLHSIQDVLFPPDAKSQAFLRSLISEQDMDPDCTLYNRSEYELDGEDDVTYKWLGPRMMDLYEELENPTPRGLLDQWLDRKSRARHVMLATVIGVFAAVFLGVLSLIVGIIQTWIAWQQWKAPPSHDA